MNTEFNYGKYNGHTLKEVLIADYSYVVWSIKNIAKFTLGYDVLEFLDSQLTDNQVYEYLQIQLSVNKGYISIEKLLVICPDKIFNEFAMDKKFIDKMQKEFKMNFTEVKKCYLESHKYQHQQNYYEQEFELDYSENQSYRRYSGSYAQDEAGFSDEDIDIVFEGDPDMYWNID